MASTGMDVNIFATKSDLALLHAEIKADIKAFESSLYEWMIPIFGVQTIAILSALFAWTHPH